MVVPVEEWKRTFSQYDKGSVAQFQNLREPENVAPDCEARDGGPVAETDGVVDAIVVERVKNGGKYGGRTEDAKHR